MPALSVITNSSCDFPAAHTVDASLLLCIVCKGQAGSCLALRGRRLEAPLPQVTQVRREDAAARPDSYTGECPLPACVMCGGQTLWTVKVAAWTGTARTGCTSAQTAGKGPWALKLCSSWKGGGETRVISSHHGDFHLPCNLART